MNWRSWTGVNVCCRSGAVSYTHLEKRKYTFYDRYQKVKYANITAEELEILNISYNKEHYMFDQQHQRNNTVLFCGLDRKSTRLNSSHITRSRMPSSA